MICQRSHYLTGCRSRGNGETCGTLKYDDLKYDYAYTEGEYHGISV